jgi:hypothetical protein
MIADSHIYVMRPVAAPCEPWGAVVDEIRYGDKSAEPISHNTMAECLCLPYARRVQDLSHSYGLIAK